jgi:hypothetical protein
MLVQAKRSLTLVAVTAVLTVIAIAVPAGGAPGDSLILGQANDAGTAGTTLTAATSTGTPVFAVTQTGPGPALSATTGSTGGVGLSASTSNPAKFAATATNSATTPGAGGGLQANAAGGGTAISATGNLSLSGACVGGCAGRPGFATKPLATQITARDTTDVGNYVSATVGADGLGLITYHDLFNGNLKVVHCSNVACTASTSSTVDSTVGDVGLYTSVAIGADGLGLISYYDNQNDDLKVAHCSNAACSTATLTTLDTTGEVGAFDSLAIGVDGFGLISYQDDTNKNLKVAHCSNTACGAAEIATIDANPGDVGSHTSIVIGVDGLGLIAYYHPADGWGLAVAHCNNVVCSSASIDTVNGNQGIGAGEYTSVTLGADGYPMISYYVSSTYGVLGVAHCDIVTCVLATTSTLDGDGVIDVGRYTSITIGADDLGLVSYYDATNGDLKLVHCPNTECSPSSFPVGPVRVETAGDVGQYTAVTIGSDGLPLIAYYDVTREDLKVAHCSNPWCVSFVRRR